MTDEQITNLIIKLTSELASLNANMKGVLDSLSRHEQRISALEQNKVGLKDSVVAWLVKGLVVAVLTIGSLTGAASLIKQALGLGD